MGSRLGRYAGLVAALLAGCTAGAPPGFSGGTGSQWTLPLVGPLEDGLLVVPALVNGKGPFLFAVDTDASVSSVDQEVVQEIAPRTGEGPKLLDETDTERDRFYAEILEWTLGSLTVRNKPAQIVPASTFDSEGRRIHGVLGRDILADSLTFAFDRDAGVVVLTTVDKFTAPPGATRIGITTVTSQITNAEVAPLSRKLVRASINGQSFQLNVDIGAVASQLRTSSWSRAGLTASALTGAVVDEVGTARKVTQEAIASSVSLGAATTPKVPFIPYADRRWRETDLDGTLGLSFFKPYDVSIDWHHGALYLAPRAGLDDVAARIGRWQSKTLSGCEHTGCVKSTLIDPTQNTPEGQRPATHPGLVLSVVRDASSLPLDLEVTLAVTAADGATQLPWLLVNIPSGVERAMTHLGPEYVGATLTVLDASPFPRTCPAAGSSCIDRLPAPQPFRPTTPSAAPVPTER